MGVYGKLASAGESGKRKKKKTWDKLTDVHLVVCLCVADALELELLQGL